MSYLDMLTYIVRSYQKFDPEIPAHRIHALNFLQDVLDLKEHFSDKKIVHMTLTWQVDMHHDPGVVGGGDV